MEPSIPADLAALQTPCLLVDVARVRHNLAAMGRWLEGDWRRWRPHVKTTKIPEVLELVLAAGVRHFKCATTREAEVLLQRASSPVDLLVAMAHHGANLRRVADLAAEFADHRLSVLTEDPRHAETVRARSSDLGLFVDLDPGYRRSGIPLADVERIEATIGAAGAALRGVQCYEGHLRGSTGERAAAGAPIYAALGRLMASLADDVELVTSGTPMFPMALRDANLQALGGRHRVSPGTVVYWDQTSEEFDIEGFLPAATVLTTVISAPDAHHVTCDAGSKAVDAACGDPCAHDPAFPHLRAGHPSEEHLPFSRCAEGAMPAPGSRLRLVPRHVCPTVNLADDAALVEGDRILGVVPVRARGHEVVVPSRLPNRVGR